MKPGSVTVPDGVVGMRSVAEGDGDGYGDAEAEAEAEADAEPDAGAAPVTSPAVSMSLEAPSLAGTSLGATDGLRNWSRTELSVVATSLEALSE